MEPHLVSILNPDCMVEETKEFGNSFSSDSKDKQKHVEHRELTKLSNAFSKLVESS